LASLGYFGSFYIIHKWIGIQGVHFEASKHDATKCKAFATNMFDKNYDGVNHALEDKCENP
jgi:hypothetical protein